MNRRRLFLSYSRQDDSYLKELVNQLGARSPQSEVELVWWFDRQEEVGIRVCEPWAQGLEKMVETCDVFCILLSPRWGDSKNCRDELAWARKYDKPVAQIRLSKADLPAGHLSQLPNESIWIGTELHRERRDTHWYEVVHGLAATSMSRWLEKPGGARAIEEFKNAVAKLHAFKVFHDLGHEFIEDRLKVVVADLKEALAGLEEAASGTARKKELSSRRLIELQAAASHLRANLAGNLTMLLPLVTEIDRLQVEKMRAALDAAGQAVDRYVDVAQPQREHVRQLDRAMWRLFSEVSLSLAHFNERMFKLAGNLDVGRFMDSLNQIIAAQQRYQQQLPLWRLLGTHTRNWVLEHNDLQQALDWLQHHEPEGFTEPDRVAAFLDELKKMEPCMQRLLIHWSDPDQTSATQSNPLVPRPEMKKKYEELEAAIEPLRKGEAAAQPELVQALQVKYDEFFRVFRKYFLDFDKGFKESTEKFKTELEGVAA